MRAHNSPPIEVGHNASCASLRHAKRTLEDPPSADRCAVGDRQRNWKAQSTGPRTVAGLERIRKARTRHGLYSAETLELRRWAAELRAEARLVLKKF